MIDWEKLRDERIPIEYRFNIDPQAKSRVGYVVGYCDGWVDLSEAKHRPHWNKLFHDNFVVLRALGNREIPQKGEWRDVTAACFAYLTPFGNVVFYHGLVFLGRIVPGYSFDSVDADQYRVMKYDLSSVRIEQKV